MRKRRYDCCFCGRSGRLCVFEDTQTFYCYGCQEWGHVVDLPKSYQEGNTPKLKKFTPGTNLTPYGALVTHPVTLPADFRLLKKGDVAWRYLEKRMIDPEPLRLYAGTYKNYIIFPIYEKGVLVYYIGRKMYGYGIRYKAAEVVGDGFVFVPYGMGSSNKELILTEGIFDCLSVYQKTGQPSIAILGRVLTAGRLSRILSYSHRSGSVSIFLDPEKKDNTILSSNLDFYLQLKRHRTVTVIHAKGIKDPGDMTEEEIMEELSARHRNGDSRAAEE